MRPLSPDTKTRQKYQKTKNKKERKKENYRLISLMNIEVKSPQKKKKKKKNNLNPTMH